MKENINLSGYVQGHIEYKDKTTKLIEFKNAITLKGKYSMAKALANQIQGDFKFYVQKMVFGNGGTVGGVPRYVYTENNGLFGLTVLSKPVVASIDVSMPQQAIFTSVVAFDEAIGQTLNEMGLLLATGDFFSLTTFPDLNKTSDMQIVWNWKINMI